MQLFLKCLNDYLASRTEWIKLITDHFSTELWSVNGRDSDEALIHQMPQVAFTSGDEKERDVDEADNQSENSFHIVNL